MDTELDTEIVDYIHLYGILELEVLSEIVCQKFGPENVTDIRDVFRKAKDNKLLFEDREK
jgi:hypothetical protein